MPRYLFNFVGADGKTFSDSLEMDEYREPGVIQRLQDRPAPHVPTYGEQIVHAVMAPIENYRRKDYHAGSVNHRSYDRPTVFYVHPSITDERALEIVRALFSE